MKNIKLSFLALQKSLILLTTTILGFNSAAFALTVNGPGTTTTNQNLTTNNETLTIGPNGNLSVSTDTAVTAANGITGTTITVNATGTNGISGVGQRAIDISSNQVSSLAINSGLVTSNASKTINFTSGLGTVIGINGTVSNTSTTGTFQTMDLRNVSNITVGSTGSILANSNTANTNATAVRLTATTAVSGSILFENNGIINAGTGKAFIVDGDTSGGQVRITNNNSTTGDINFNNTNSIFVNNLTTSVYTGNIYATTTTASNASTNNININIDRGTFNGNMESSVGGEANMKIELSAASITTGNITLNGNSTASYVQLLGSSFPDRLSPTLNGNILSTGALKRVVIYDGQINGTIKGNITTYVSGQAFPDLNYHFNGDVGETGSLTDSLHLTQSANAYNDSSAINTGTIQINNDSTFYAGAGAIKTNTINIEGTLDMTTVAKNITGTSNITTQSNGTIDFGRHAHTNIGTFTAVADANIATEITSPTVIGHLTSSGRVTNDPNTNLNVTIDYRNNTYNSGKYYYVLTGDSGSSATIQGVTDDNIHIINVADGQTLATATNRAGVLTYHSRRDANNLVLYVDLADKTTISARPSEQNVFVAIDQIGANQTGEIKEMQTYIITSNLVTPTQRQDALASLTPNDIGLHKTVIDNSMASMVAAEKRLEEVRDRFRLGRKVQNDARFASSSSYKILDQNGNELYASEDDDTSLYAALARSKKARKSTKDFNKNSSARDFNDNRSYVPPRNNLFTAWPSKSNGLWIQPIFTNARQETNKDFDGYTANSYGVTLGYDRMIAVNTVLGASVSAIKGDINTSGNLKESDINSYQFNLYAGEFCPTYFLDAVVGVAYNKYDSSRHMPVIGATAKASFSGNTYSGRARAGYITKPGRNWDLIPEVNLTYAKNNLGSYSENGAGTANLNVTNNDATFIEGAIGASIGYSGYAKKDEAFYPRLKVMYGYAFKGFEQSSNSGWIGQNFTFYTQSAKQSRSSVRADLGVNIFTLKSVIVSANYLYEYRTTDFRSHSGVLRVSYQF